MRWKNHKKIHSLCWLSFICTFFVAIFSNTNNIYADTPSAIGIKPLTDQQLAALISKADKANPIATPPKINGKDIYLNPLPTQYDAPTPQTANTQSLERCLYNNQYYVLGDMVNTNQGWMRCTQGIVFSNINSTVPHNSEAIWTKIQ